MNLNESNVNPTPQPRFQPIADSDVSRLGFESSADTLWYWDTRRPLTNDAQPFVAVQCYASRDPNTEVVYHSDLTLLFTDQAEYYVVCPVCRYAHYDKQWSGSTHLHNWRERAENRLKAHQATKGWCEFCDPVFGNGGWA